MNINGDLIKELRLKKSWSQERLADVAGISMRTVQRMEIDGVASLQSRVAISSALEINPADMISEQQSPIDTLINIAAEDDELSFELPKSARMFIRPAFRFLILTMLWIGKVITAFLIIMLLISGIFYMDVAAFSYRESVSNGIVGAAFFIPIYLAFRYLQRRLTESRATEAAN
jgi:transcriptional regulator with XRE-family HTH domain